MRGQYSQAANTHMMKIGCSVDYVRSGGMRNVPVTKAVSICMRLLINFQGAYSWPHVLRTLTHHVGVLRSDSDRQEWNTCKYPLLSESTVPVYLLRLLDNDRWPESCVIEFATKLPIACSRTFQLPTHPNLKLPN
ncbi:hypothetical protein AVEN_110692-1 [Araneus ventricosus]|uniref:Uncharacterized protein n=1 Tax=Araneus ventricosus TaxID=182803 RepID=A0A4Y2AW47_ARAVE|nr:hypothetical protein AVEN_110692-1 [Araneus ventricosus]